MTDTWALGGLIVYNWFSDSSRRFDHTSLHGDPSSHITINNSTFSMPGPSDGIALTPDAKWIYYCTLASPYLWRVPTALLSNFSLTSEQIGQGVELVSKTKGISDGMAFDRNGVLYYGRNEANAFMARSIATGLEKIVVQDDVQNIWVDTLAFSNQQVLWTTNQLPFFFANQLNATHSNFRIWTAFIGTGSYLSGNPQPPHAQCVDV